MAWGAWRLCHWPEVWLARPSDAGALPPQGRRIHHQEARFWISGWTSHALDEQSLPGDLAAELQGPFADLLVEDRTVEERVERALREGRLRAYRLPVGGSAGGAAARSPAPDLPAPAALAEQKTWIGIQLMLDDVDPPAPAAMRRFRLELTDGTVCAGLLDMNGQALVREIDPGTCTLHFPGLHGGDWWPEGDARPAPGARVSPSVQHEVRPGDHVARLAAAYGFEHHRDIWDHPANVELLAVRPSPDLLAPGDIVTIPEHVDKGVEIETGRHHPFAVKHEALRLRLRAQDRAAAAIAGASCLFEVDRVPWVLSTDAGGVVERAIARKAARARVAVGDLEAEIDIGWLDPIETPSGWLTRLLHLGYLPHREGVNERRIEAAIEEFQYEEGCLLTGEMDGATRDALRDAHGC
jgi:hypothetical protein